jgi:ABC-type glycerol-3-phosphate transport system substrate-binding protein
MNKLKKTLALMAALAMTATAFVGCSDDSSSTSTSSSEAESSVAEEAEESEAEEAEESEAEEVESSEGYENVEIPELGTPDGTLGEGGDTLTILCWTEDDLKYMYDIVADATGLDASMIEYKNIGSSGSDAKEQYAQTFLSGEDVDLYLCDADWNMAYQNNDEYSAPLSAVGITEDMYANAYDYTVSMGKDSNGVLKGATWQSAPGGYSYRADLAEEYLGVTSPDEMQALIGDWDSFWATAATVYEQSGGVTAMADSLGGVWRAYSNGNRTSSWVDADGKLDSSSLGDFISMAKTNFDAGYISGATQWNDDWLPQGQSDGSQANKTFGFFFSTWSLASGAQLETAEGGTSGSTYGQFAICQGPTSWFWGGTWICVYPGTDNATEDGQFIYTMTCNADAMQKYVDAHSDFVNNKGVMADTVAAGTHTNDLYVDGQDQFSVLFDVADGIDMSIATQYDATINDDLSNAISDYCNGVTASEDDCLNAFLDSVAADVTDIVVE